MNIKVKYDPLSSAIDNTIQGKAIYGSIADFCKKLKNALYGNMPFSYFVYDERKCKKIYNNGIEVRIGGYMNNVTVNINNTNKNIIDICFLIEIHYKDGTEENVKKYVHLNLSNGETTIDNSTIKFYRNESYSIENYKYNDVELDTIFIEYICMILNTNSCIPLINDLIFKKISNISDTFVITKIKKDKEIDIKYSTEYYSYNINDNILLCENNAYIDFYSSYKNSYYKFDHWNINNKYYTSDKEINNFFVSYDFSIEPIYTLREEKLYTAHVYTDQKFYYYPPELMADKDIIYVPEGESISIHDDVKNSYWSYTDGHNWYDSRNTEFVHAAKIERVSNNKVAFYKQYKSYDCTVTVIGSGNPTVYIDRDYSYQGNGVYECFSGSNVHCIDKLGQGRWVLTTEYGDVGTYPYDRGCEFGIGGGGMGPGAYAELQRQMFMDISDVARSEYSVKFSNNSHQQIKGDNDYIAYYVDNGEGVSLEYYGDAKDFNWTIINYDNGSTIKGDTGASCSYKFNGNAIRFIGKGKGE